MTNNVAWSDIGRTILLTGKNKEKEMKVEINLKSQILIGQIMEGFVNAVKPIFQFYTPGKCQKTLENQGFFDVFRGCRNGTIA